MVSILAKRIQRRFVYLTNQKLDSELGDMSLIGTEWGVFVEGFAFIIPAEWFHLASVDLENYFCIQHNWIRISSDNHVGWSIGTIFCEDLSFIISYSLVPIGKTILDDKGFFVWPNKLNDERKVENLTHIIPPKLCTSQQKIKMLTTDDRCHVMAITHKTLSVSVSAW